MHLPCGLPDRGILLTPACGQLGPCAVADPGVFQVAATAAGASACARLTFATAIIDPAFGTVRFTPGAGAHVTLGTGASCVINFTVDVLKSPAVDVSPGTAGNQTAQFTTHTQVNGLGTTAVGSGSSSVTRAEGRTADDHDRRLA